MSPGGDEATIKELMPLLEAFAVNDPKTDIPCVTYIGPGGAVSLRPRRRLCTT
jgi:6-phosphogluconate dehydrogenase